MKTKPHRYWCNKENCAKEALRYTTIQEFRNSPTRAYRNSKKFGWLEEITSHLLDVKTKRNEPYNKIWTYDKCKEISLACSSRNEVKRLYGTAYNVIRHNNWTSVMFSHMKEKLKLVSEWTYAECQKEAKIYSHRSDFKNGSRCAYDACRKKHWLDDVCSHMRKKKTLPTRTGINEETVFVPFIKEYFRKYDLLLTFNKNILMEDGSERFPDCYIPALNLVIEYDEHYHDRQQQRLLDDIREKQLKETLNCDFIRVKEKLFLENKEEYFEKLFMKWYEFKLTIDK